MEPLKVTHDGNLFRIEGFPDAAKIIEIKDPKARRLANLSLHQADLEFSIECLIEINNVSEKSFVLRQALWRSAVVHFIKCFGGSESRFSLDPKVIYKDDKQAIEQYIYFDSLRNKHFVHDENSYLQCLTGAILNKKDKPHKIAQIACLTLLGDTLSQATYNNLYLLLKLAHSWVVDQFDRLSQVITKEMEAMDYAHLFSFPEVTYSLPTSDDIHKKRS